MKKIKIIITDLDGTLYNSNNKAGEKNLEILHYLQSVNILRVIATGRNLFSAKKIIPADFPIDYLVFSSGAGIIHWPSQKIIYSQKLSQEMVSGISNFLLNEKVNLAIHKAIPENHFYIFKKGVHNCEDFYLRNESYAEFCSEIKNNAEVYTEASQFLVILPNEINIFHNLKKKLLTQFPNLKIIRATSPINGTSIWLEIFPKNVSKGLTVKWLCDLHNIHQQETVGIGNDYNDEDLLNWTYHSFMVKNAPDELKLKFRVTDSNNHNGVANAIESVLKEKESSL